MKAGVAVLLVLVACSHPPAQVAPMPVYTAPEEPSGRPADFHLRVFATVTSATVDPPVTCSPGNYLIVVHGHGHRHLARRLPRSCRDTDAGGSCSYIENGKFWSDLMSRRKKGLHFPIECGDRPYVAGLMGGWADADDLVGVVIQALADSDLDEDVGVYVEPTPTGGTLL